jgi:outer membrane protein insertion porin family
MSGCRSSRRSKIPTTRKRGGSNCASRSRGPRYKVGSFDVAGNTVVKSEFLKPLFKLKAGDYYGEKRIRKGLEKARETYGTGGYYEFTGFPDYKFHDDPNPNEPEVPEALKAAANAKEPPGPPVVDVTMRMQEGQQFFVNRITFTGNTTTRDNVIRREMRLVEGGVFNTEALKYSVKRLNQLGYFKALEGKPGEVDVQKTPNATNKIDVKLKLEEQNRNSSPSAPACPSSKASSVSCPFRPRTSWDAARA